MTEVKRRARITFGAQHILHHSNQPHFSPDELAALEYLVRENDLFNWKGTGPSLRRKLADAVPSEKRIHWTKGKGLHVN
jgi:hypothetical protein